MITRGSSARVSPLMASTARWSLTALGSSVVPEYADRCWWYHRAIAEALEGALRYARFRGERGGYARVAISMPPQHGKSLHGRELFPALALGQDPDLRIIVSSNTMDIAKQGVANTRTWVDTAGYKAAFATRFGKVEELSVKTGKRTRVIETADSSQFFRAIKPAGPRGQMTEAHGYYLAQGIGGSIVGWGYDIGIMDDLIRNAEQALSARHHEKLWEFYTSVFDTRERSDHAVQVYIGTRWTKPDFADELIEYWQAQSTPDHPLPMKVLKLPALAEPDLPLDDYDPRGDEAFKAKHGAGLDKPTQRKESYYIGKRNALLTQVPWTWYGSWQQEPRMLGTKFFQEHEWGYFTEDFPLHTFSYIDFSLDAALSKTGPSFGVITVAGVLNVVARPGMEAEQGEHFFLLDEARGHWSYEELCDEYVRLCKKWSAALPSAFRNGSHWVENKALGPQLIAKHQGEYPIVAVPKAKAKIWCYRIAAPVISQMRVRLPRGTWGTDPTCPALPLVTDEWVGSARVKGSWVHEVGNYPNEPADRRDTLAQLVICRAAWLGGPDTLGHG